MARRRVESGPCERSDQTVSEPRKDDPPAWLGKRLPRYTSYPTAPHFGPLEARSYGRWLSDLTPPKRASLYVHIPFCRALCWFCGCHTQVTNDYHRVEAYLEALEREIDLVGRRLQKGIGVSFLHFGGGSPTILKPDDFERLMAALRQAFTFERSAEIAVEIDPRSVGADRIASYAKTGVGRVSIGVQDFDPMVQEAIHRFQPFSLVSNTVAAFRREGIEKINFDLIYGLPYQSLESVIRTALQVMELAPSRIALFGYAHVPWMKKHQRLIPESTLPGDAVRLQLYDAMARVFEENGYVPVGMDHFARHDDELAIAVRQKRVRRNFQGYTTDDAEVLLGLGASAIGRLPQGFAQNTPDLKAYRQASAAGRLATARGRPYQDHDLLFGEVIERLMSNLEVDLEAVAVRYGAPMSIFADSLARLAPLVEDQVVRLDGPKIRLFTPHRVAIRAVAACFDQYLGQSQTRHSSVA